MAETVIGTAGVFFTLVLIAVGSFVVGLAIYGIVDFFHAESRRRRRSRRSSMTREARHAALAVAAADAACRASKGAADALLRTIGDDGAGSDSLRWGVACEFAWALARVFEGHVLARSHGTDIDVLVRVTGDCLCGELHRLSPEDGGAIHARMGARLSEYRKLPGDFRHLHEPPQSLMDACAGHILAHLNNEVDVPQLRRNVADLVRSGASIDLAGVLRQ
jgi:hypothetical protein